MATPLPGSGRIGGYGVVNLESTYHPAPLLDLFVKAVNVFDKHHATAGFLTSNGFDANGAFRPDPDDWTNENGWRLWAGVRLRLK